MQRTLTKLLALAAAVVGSALYTAEPAFAQAPPQGSYHWSTAFTYNDPLNPNPKGNATCYRLTTTTNPPTRQIGAVADFIYCGAQIPSANPNLGYALQAYYQGMPAAAQNALYNAKYQVIYYATVGDKCQTLSSSECSAWYQGGGGDYGLTNPKKGTNQAQTDIYVS